MNNEAPERCAAREEFSVEGVWGCCPIKRNGAPVRCSVFCFRGPESIACYNLFISFSRIVAYREHHMCLFHEIRAKTLKSRSFCGIIYKSSCACSKHSTEAVSQDSKGVPMRVSYDKLWRLMKNNKMKKSELAKAAEISSYAMTKLNNDRPVSMEVMINLCKVFHCDIGDLMEVIED